MKYLPGDFSPDLDTTTPNILLDASWCWSTPAGPRGLEMPTASARALSGKALGGYIANFGIEPVAATVVAPATTTGVVLVFAATASQIYQWLGIGSNFTLISPTYKGGVDWVFDTYGNDIIAVNGVDVPQVFTQGSSAAFGPLANAPVASIVAASDFALFLIAGNAWIASPNDTIWAVGIENEVAAETITSTPGNITAAKGLRGGMAMYKETAVHYATFTGPPFFWQVNNSSEVVGTPGAHSVVSYRDTHYFVGPDDFYTFDGWSVTPIPNNVKVWFFHQNLDRQYAGNIRGVANPSRNQIVWFYPSINANPRGSLDSMIAYSTVTGRFLPSPAKVDLPLEGEEPLNGPSPLVGQLGLSYIDNNHILQLLLEPIGEAPQPRTPISFVTTGDLGDKTNVFEISRVRPGFLGIPSRAPQSGLSKLTVLSQYIQGQAKGLIAGPTSVFSNWGFFDFVSANKLQRLCITLLPRLTLTDLDVAIRNVGRQ